MRSPSLNVTAGSYPNSFFALSMFAFECLMSPDRSGAWNGGMRVPRILFNSATRSLRTTLVLQAML